MKTMTTACSWVILSGLFTSDFPSKQAGIFGISSRSHSRSSVYIIAFSKYLYIFFHRLYLT